MKNNRLRCGSSTGVLERFDKEVIEMYANAGVAAVEVALPFVNYFAYDWKELKKYADTVGVDFWSVHLPFGGDNNMYNIANPKYADRTVSDDERLLIKAGEVGMRAAVVHPSAGPIPADAVDQWTETAISSLNKLVKIGKREGVDIAVEIMQPHALGSSIKGLKAIVDSVPGLKVCMDVNHLNGYSHDEFVDVFGDKIATVHISDYELEGEKHWMPGKGKINWQNILKLLNKINYNGPFMYEIGNADFNEGGLKGIKENYDKIMKGEI